MSQVQRQTTSIKIRPDVWKKAKIEAIKDDIDLAIFVEDAISFWISKRNDFSK